MSASAPSSSSTTASFVAELLGEGDQRAKRLVAWRNFRGFLAPGAQPGPPQVTRETLSQTGLLDQARALAADIALFALKKADELGLALDGERILVTFPSGDGEPAYLCLASRDPVQIKMPGEIDVVNGLSRLRAQGGLRRHLLPRRRGIWRLPLLWRVPEQTSLLGRLDRLEKAHSEAKPPIAKAQATPDFLDDLLYAIQPVILEAPMPSMVPLCAPFPSLEVRDGDKVSTAGILVRDAAGQRGFTAAYHATGPVGTPVRLGGFDAVVAAASPLHDTVFLLLPDGAPVPDLRGRKGVMTARPPYDNEPVRFHGTTSGELETWVTSHDKGLPDVVPGRQRCVQTEPHTNEGDSGAALVNQDDQVVGFAFQRTAWGKKPQFTDWVWARGALGELELQADVQIAGET